ncbi:fibrobacter succinogenes major paralogous domain-containing protein [Dysgonomonas reticulitermitis]
MRTIINRFKGLLPVAMLLFPVHCLQAQITIGSGIESQKAALLDLKTRQGTAAITAVTDPDNVSSDKGLLLPRVQLENISTLEPFIPDDDPDFIANTGNLKERLAGLMVYNITLDGTIYPAVYTWNGAQWRTSQANAAVPFYIEKDGQPKKFAFYETGEPTTIMSPLEFRVVGPGDWTYRWYQVTSHNMHVRIAKPVGEPGTVSGTGADSNSFIPSGVLKGTTRDANNAGFYRFYCVAESSLGAHLESDIAEVAVGCGAKNSAGEWLSFMCLNLGATKLTIGDQQNYPVNLTEPSDCQALYGSLFQWGRIADGHELRSATGVNKFWHHDVIAVPPVQDPLTGVYYNEIKISDIISGQLCPSSGIPSPYYQVDPNGAWHGLFIWGYEDWTPAGQSQTASDLLWRTGRFIQNDPCAHYKTDGTYQAFWATGPGSDACTDAGTAWRTPTQEEWGELYKGGTHSGSPATATANTWVWNSSGINGGYEIKPDGVNTTLFLPASGLRDTSSDSFGYQGSQGQYWSVGIVGKSGAHALSFNNEGVDPADAKVRSSGFALRCIKDL